LKEETVSNHLKVILNLLESGGKLIISTPNRNYKELLYKERAIPKNPYHEREYYPSEIMGLLGKYFNVEGIFGETYLDGDIPKLIKNSRYVSECKIPSQIRKFIPRRVKDYVLKARGLPPVPTWKDYIIQKLNSVDELVEKYSTQLFVCTRN
jgi:hypothetical protein